jgi:hypothetical protein
MALQKQWRETEKTFEELGLEVVEHRQARSSHRIYTLEYRGFHKIMTVSGVKGSNTAKQNRTADLVRFKRLVDQTHAGERPPLPDGVWRA